MKVDIPVPFEKLAWFQEKLGLGKDDLRRIGACRDVFLEPVRGKGTRCVIRLPVPTEA